MTSWNSGYVADFGYTFGFYRELTPSLLSFVKLAKEQRGPDVSSPITYCELGCGQGVSTNVLAAANPHIEFHATDFNPAHIAGAQALAAEARLANVHFYENSFADFADEPSLPKAFDIIALHGIYSWISAENRAHIVSFIQRKLKPGGLVYISYNALPGWSGFLPLRRLMVDHSGQSKAPLSGRVDEALEFLERMQKAKAGFFTQNPRVSGRAEKLKPMSRVYLAHEYFNSYSNPFYFADLAAELAEAKLTFLGSANLLDHVDTINLSPDQLDILNESGDPVRREGLRDFMVNEQFRRDVFVKGAIALPQLAAREAWLDARFVLSSPRADVPLKVKGVRGEGELHAETYNPLLDVLEKGPVTVRELLADPKVAEISWNKLVQALIVLVGQGNVQPCLPAAGDAVRATSTRAFNRAVCERARAVSEIHFLASPITGGGYAVERFQQLFLLALQDGIEDPVDSIWSLLDSQNQRINKDGTVLATREENIAELNTRFEAFKSKRLPILQTLGIA